MKPVLKPPGSMLLKLSYDGPLSQLAFEFNLRRCGTAIAVRHRQRRHRRPSRQRSQELIPSRHPLRRRRRRQGKAPQNTPPSSSPQCKPNPHFLSYVPTYDKIPLQYYPYPKAAAAAPAAAPNPWAKINQRLAAQEPEDDDHYYSQEVGRCRLTAA